MKKLTDAEFKAFAAAMAPLTAHPSEGNPGLSAARKLLANYQEQLEAESFVAAERYSEANTEPTMKVVCDDSYAPTYSFKDEGR